jgi:hypothetical protein
MSRAGIFRVLHGVAVEMTERVYKLPSFNGKFFVLLLHILNILLQISKEAPIS